jgi:hypothetical protein
VKVYLVFLQQALQLYPVQRIQGMCSDLPVGVFDSSPADLPADNEPDGELHAAGGGR